MLNYFYYLFALSLLAAIPLFKYVSTEKAQADNFKDRVIAIRLVGLTFFILLVTIILFPFSYASGGGFLGNNPWSETSIPISKFSSTNCCQASHSRSILFCSF